MHNAVTAGAFATEAVFFSGLCGALFSPLASRLKGIHLGIASIALVFVGIHVLLNASSLTGGYSGRNVQPLVIGGFSFTDGEPSLTILGVPYGQLERLWYVGLIASGVAIWCARGLTGSRAGRALRLIRDSETAAAANAVDVARYKAAVFTFASVYAGAAGVLLALAYGRLVPESFGFIVALDYLAMIVIGGLGSIGGAVIGATLVSCLPLLFSRYAEHLPFLGSSSSGGIGPAEASRLIYGATLVLVLLIAPRGIAGLWAKRRRRRPNGPSQNEEVRPTPHA